MRDARGLFRRITVGIATRVSVTPMPSNPRSQPTLSATAIGRSANSPRPWRRHLDGARGAAIADMQAPANAASTTATEDLGAVAQPEATRTTNTSEAASPPARFFHSTCRWRRRRSSSEQRRSHSCRQLAAHHPAETWYISASLGAAMSKPVVFISHIHRDEACANAFEQVLRRALLGAVDVFNSSNRRSISVGDAWRDKIIESLRRSATVLILASPDSVSSPWVNFEAGGAWISERRVVPACIKGMKPESLPAPLSHLQAVSLDSADGLRILINLLSETAGLDKPADFDFDQATDAIVSSWKTQAPAMNNTAFLEWYTKVKRRPEKYKGESAVGFFRVKHLSATDRQKTEQFHKEGLRAGDAITFWLELEGPGSEWTTHCFANGSVADFLETVNDKTLLRGTVKALGQMKVFETIIDMGDEERGVSYPAAWRVMDATNV